MNKKLTAVGTLCLAGALAVSLCACGTVEAKQPYEVASQLGYSGTESQWISSVSNAGTTARALYAAAKEEGFEGSFIDFLNATNAVSSDDTVNVNTALASVVSVWCNFTEKTASNDYWWQPSTQEKSVTSAGSGVIYSLDKENGNALVITNYHVVYDKSATSPICDDITLFLYGGETQNGAITATYVGGAMDFDIAVLRVENSEVLKESSAKSARISDSDAITVGERAYAIGNPEGGGIAVSSGIVSVDAEYINIQKLSDSTKTVSLLEIRTDAAVNPGNSGGGLFNADGNLIGIVNAKTGDTSVEGLGYAIPSNLAIAVAQNIIDNSAVNTSKGALRATLGVTVQTENSKSVFDEDTQKFYVEETVVISGVTSGSAAAGKLKKGDVLYSVTVNGREKIITRLHMLGNTMFDVRMGDTVTVKVSRDGNTLEIPITFTNEQFTLYN